jgi:ATP-dependent DNA helicase RecG
MPQAEYERGLLERTHPLHRWENQVAGRYRLKQLDMKEIRRAMADARAAARLESLVTDPLEALERLKLSENGRLLQAAVVAFAKEVLPNYPQCALRMARFRGTTKTDFLDQRQLTGHAFLLLGEADLFLRRHLPVAGHFEPGLLERQDEPLFPPLALREALVNALCHRDYSIAGGSVNVAIFDDRLEISSTGLLPSGLTVADLKRRHPSLPRNPILANVFYLRGLIERWGRGTQKIVELCVRAGHPEPEFEECAGEVVVRFVASGYVPQHRVNHDLSERQRRVLHILQRGTRLRAGEIRSALSPSPSTTAVRDDLNLLRSLGLIDGSGHGAGARWWLTSPELEE